MSRIVAVAAMTACHCRTTRSSTHSARSLQASPSPGTVSQSRRTCTPPPAFNQCSSVGEYFSIIQNRVLRFLERRVKKRTSSKVLE